MPDPQNDTPDTPSLAWKRQRRAADLCRDCYEGPLRIEDKGRTYLPQFERESNKAYANRLQMSNFYDFFGRTIRGLTGMVFRRDPQLAGGLPPILRTIWENVDGAGTHASVFLRERHQDGEVDGHYAIFVDCPPTSDDVRSLEDERALLPYWIGLRKQDILAARTAVRGGKTVLVHLRYRYTTTEPEGAYGEVEVERIREYNLIDGEKGPEVRFVVHRKTRDGKRDVWLPEETGTLMRTATEPMRRIPLAAAYFGDRKGTLDTDPPNLALARENIRHYQLTSDNDNVLHIASVPQLAVIGARGRESEKDVAPSNAWDLPEGGDLKYVEPAGTALEAAERRIEKSEKRMALLGMSSLYADSRAPETATSKRIDKSESDSALSSHARATQDAAEEAIGLTAEWLGLDLPERNNDARWVTVNRDFEALSLDPQKLAAYADLVPDKLSLETFWSVLEAYEELPSDFDPEVERQRIESAGLDAAAEAMRLVREAQARRTAPADPAAQDGGRGQPQDNPMDRAA